MGKEWRGLCVSVVEWSSAKARFLEPLIRKFEVTSRFCCPQQIHAKSFYILQVFFFYISGEGVYITIASFSSCQR